MNITHDNEERGYNKDSPDSYNQGWIDGKRLTLDKVRMLAATANNLRDLQDMLLKLK